MVLYRCIGKGTTGDDGVARITHDCEGNALSHTGYKGAGRGVVSMVASLESPDTMDNTKLQSQVFDVYDCLKYDIATTSKHTDDMWNGSISRGSEYSTITGNTRYTTMSGDVGIELDLMSSMDGHGQLIVFRSGSTLIKALSLSDCGMTSDTWKHIKITIKDNLLTVDGTSIIDEDIEGYNRFYLRAIAEETINFKNLVIYTV